MYGDRARLTARTTMHHTTTTEAVNLTLYLAILALRLRTFSGWWRLSSSHSSVRKMKFPMTMNSGRFHEPVTSGFLFSWPGGRGSSSSTGFGGAASLGTGGAAFSLLFEGECASVELALVWESQRLCSTCRAWSSGCRWRATCWPRAETAALHWREPSKSGYAIL